MIPTGLLLWVFNTMVLSCRRIALPAQPIFVYLFVFFFHPLQGAAKDYRCTADGLIPVSGDALECTYEVADF